MSRSPAFAAVVAAGLALAPARAQEPWDYEQIIRYMGMGCNKVQGDSVLYPANEIAVMVAATDIDTGYTTKVTEPNGRAYYEGVDDGDFYLGPGSIVWRGAPQSVDLNVVMTEIDGGSEQTLAFTKASFTAIQIAYGVRGGAVAGGAAARMAGAARMRPAGQPASLTPEPSFVEKAVAGALDDIFGTGNDLIGHDIIHLVDDDYSGGWASDAMNQIKGVGYHLATRHTRGGADCYAFFRYEQGDLLPSYYEGGGEDGAWDQGPADGVGLEEYFCEVDGRSYHVMQDGWVAEYFSDGSRHLPGEAFDPRDPACHFEFDIYEGSNPTYCVGDLGEVRLSDWRGRTAGQCWVCSGDDCRP